MNTLAATQPIGLLDSGIGGLTIVSALQQILPGENIVYFGDNAHFPYGEKSPQALQHYVRKISDFLLQRQCKLLVVACYTATAVAYATLQQHTQGKVLLDNVIDPMITFVGEHYANKSIGLIATRQTVRSQCYAKRLAQLNRNITLHSQETPLLAPLIEEGLAHRRFVDDVLHVYLDKPQMRNIDALILGCTHYPLIKERIAHYYQNKVHILDSSAVVAQHVAQQLQTHQLCNPQLHGEKKFYLSDYSASTIQAAKYFFAGKITFDYHELLQ